MYIKEFEIRDLRCFQGKQVVSLDRGDGSYAGWTVFAGRNGSGKSTLLKALAASIVGPMTAKALAQSFPAWVRKGVDRGLIVTCLSIDPTGGDVIHERAEAEPEAERDPMLSEYLELSSELSPGLLFQSTDLSTDKLTHWVSEYEPAEVSELELLENSLWSAPERGWFICGYGPYRRLGKASSEADPYLSRLLNLFNENATLANAVDWLKEVQFRAHEGKPGAAKLRDDVLTLLNNGLLPDNSRVVRVDSDGLWVERDGVSLPLDQVSDGYRTVTALVIDLVRRLHDAFGNLSLDSDLSCPHPGVVLIDEVDSHMHVEWQQKIGFWLTRHFPAIQFLVTTHSPFICQAASPRGLIRLPAPGEDRKIEHVEGRLFNAVVNGSADDAVMSELFGLEHPHSAPAEAIRERLANLEVKVIEGEATNEEVKEYDDLRNKLPDDIGALADQKLRALGKRRIAR
jgi:energy-coupling factor transporter ATP-binding protein EcfA2